MQGRAGELDADMVENCLEFLRKEVEMLRLRVVVAVGKGIYLRLEREAGERLTSGA